MLLERAEEMKELRRSGSSEGDRLRGLASPGDDTLGEPGGSGVTASGAGASGEGDPDVASPLSPGPAIGRVGEVTEEELARVRAQQRQWLLSMRPTLQALAPRRVGAAQDAVREFAQTDVEDVVDALESLGGRMGEVHREVQRAVRRYRGLQVSESLPLRQQLQAKLRECEELIARLRDVELHKRDDFDALAHRAAKAKRTVATAKDLGVASAHDLSSSLKEAREQRAAAQRELDSVISERNRVQLQIQNLSALLGQLRLPTDDRDYNVLLQEASAPAFFHSFGGDRQREALAQLQQLAEYRISQRRGELKLAEIEACIVGVRSRIAEIVAACWR